MEKKGKYYRIEYDDGDGEDMAVKQLRQHVHVPKQEVRGSERSSDVCLGRLGEKRSQTWRKMKEAKERERRKEQEEERKNEKGRRRRRKRAERGEVRNVGDATLGAGGGYRHAAIERLLQGLAAST